MLRRDGAGGIRLSRTNRGISGGTADIGTETEIFHEPKHDDWHEGSYLFCGTLKTEGNMPPNPAIPSGPRSVPEILMRRLLGSASIFSLVMTIPQVLTIWVGRRAAGVSLFSWTAYLITALLWLWHGIRERDRNIYLPCIGWIALDSAVILGAVIYG